MNDFVLEKLSKDLTEMIKNGSSIEDVQDFLADNYKVKLSLAKRDEDDLKEKVNLFLEAKQLEGVKDSTLLNYRCILNKFIKFTNKKVEDITIYDLRKFLAQETTNKKKSTKSSYHSYMKSFFNWMYNEEIIDKNPATKLAPTPMPRKLRKSLSYTEVEKLRIACKTPRERALMEVLLATGCRVSECANLNRSDFENNPKLAIKIIGKGDKSRTVYFNEKAKLYVNLYLKTRDDTQEALFVSEREPHQRLKRRALGKIITNIANRTDIDRSVFPHLLRHTFASLGLKSGADITSIQNLLGHSDLKTTQIYTETSEEEVNHQYKTRFNF